jgi:hypothetical protein
VPYFTEVNFRTFHMDVFNLTHSFLTLCGQLEIKRSFFVYFLLFLTANDPLGKNSFFSRPPTQQQDIYITFSQSGLRNKIGYYRIVYCDVRKSRFIYSHGMKLVNVCRVQMLVNPLTYRRFPIYAVIILRMIRRKSNSAQVGIPYDMAQCVGI